MVEAPDPAQSASHSVLHLPETAAIPGLSVGTSRHRVRMFADGGDRAADQLAQYRIASLTKPFTAAAVVLTLAGRGISPTTAAVELLPDLAADWRADPGITVGQLLGQVSGLRESVDARALAAAGVGDEPDAIEKAARLAVLAGNEHAPGERRAYYNGNYFVAGAVLEAVTGLTYEEAVEQTVLRPWELDRTGFGTPAEPVSGYDGPSPVPTGCYPEHGGQAAACGPVQPISWPSPSSSWPRRRFSPRLADRRPGPVIPQRTDSAGNRTVRAALPQRASPRIPERASPVSRARLRQRRAGQPDERPAGDRAYPQRPATAAHRR